jgi:putative ABC transport system permease protein
VIEALRRTLFRVLALVRSRALDADLEQEIEHHLALAADEHVRQGLSPHEARRRARLDFGGIQNAREAHRQARALPLLESAIQDTAYALRGFRRHPVFALGAVFVLALAIGVNTAVFSIVRPILLRPLPFANPDQLVWISPSSQDGRSIGTYTGAAFDEIKHRTRSFSQLTAYYAFFQFSPLTLTGLGEAEALTGTMVTPDFFATLGVPLNGRAFSSGEAAPTGFGGTAVVLSHGLWQRRFAGDTTLVGKTLSFNFGPATVVGILPADFDFGSVFAPGIAVDLFLPLPAVVPGVWGNALSMVGRLNPGVSPAAAQAELDVLLPQLRQEHPDWGAITALVTDLNTHVNGRFRGSIELLWGSVGLVLLVACANLSNLLFGRATARTREFEIRTALGASRGRIVRQFLTEGLLLAIGGAAAGVPIAYLLVGVVRSSATLAIPLLEGMTVDGGAMLFAGSAAVVAGLGSMAFSALRISRRRDAFAREQPGAATPSPVEGTLRSLLVVSEVALTCLLLVGAGLLARSFLNAINVDLGFQPARAHRARLNLPLELMGLDQTIRRSTILDEVTSRVRALPGIEAAGITDALPLERSRGWAASDPGQVYAPGRRPAAFLYVTGPGYLRAMGIPLIAGRDFSADDTLQRRAVIVNERLARRLWPGQDPLGRPLVTSWPGTYTVVGVTADVRQSRLEEPSSVFQMYLPYTQVPVAALDLIVRSSLPAATLGPAIRSTLGSIDPNLMASPLRPIDELVDNAASPRLFLMRLVSEFSLLAMLLASVGIYSVVSYGVTQRFHEIGVRVALGATSRAVCRHVMSAMLGATIVGILSGMLAAAGAARLIAAMLYNTSPAEPAVFALVPLVVACVALLAAYVPARRAGRIDPVVALRTE